MKFPTSFRSKKLITNVFTFSIKNKMSRRGGEAPAGGNKERKTRDLRVVSTNKRPKRVNPFEGGRSPPSKGKIHKVTWHTEVCEGFTCESCQIFDLM